MVTPLLRPARADETDAIFAVHRDAVTSQCGDAYPPAQVAAWLDGRTPAMYLPAIERGALWVADDAGAVVGFVEHEGHEVTKLFVRGDQAGRGLGGRLLAHAIEAIGAGGARAVYLEATTNACDFYRRRGFRVLGPGTFARGGVALAIVRMERALDAGAP